jgi:NNP family nitrate/nitrite transporter-like MFS transporter
MTTKDSQVTDNETIIQFGPQEEQTMDDVQNYVARRPIDEFEWMQDPYAGTPGSKYPRYELPVEHEEGDRAMEIKLWSFKRPHMRAFHCAWFSFFCAFSVWFAPAPLLTEIADTLNLSKKEIWNSSIANDIAAIILRVLAGPICDARGARIPMAVVLVAASIPTFMVGLVQSATGLVVIRLFIGVAGCSFVMAQFWPSRMFSREIAGTANGTYLNERERER